MELCVWGSHCRGSDLADDPGVRSTPKLGKGLQLHFLGYLGGFFSSYRMFFIDDVYLSHKLKS